MLSKLPFRRYGNRDEAQSLGSMPIDALRVRADSKRYDVKEEVARGGMGVI